jgi:hypothetical protein
MSYPIKIPKDISDNIRAKSLAIAQPTFQKELQNQFEQIKTEMIAEFMNHPVTEEIMNGANSSNISGTLSDRSGNLFSYIGFEANDNPIIPILDLLLDTKVAFSNIKSGAVLMKITIPSAESIFKKTPMPWASGRSWAKGIESGISGLGYYIQKFNKGRSEGGIQLKQKISSGKFKNVPYISFIINKYSKIFTSIEYASIKIKKI